MFIRFLLTPKYLVGALIALVGYKVLAYFDALEWWVAVTAPYEAFELDELPLVFPCLFLWFVWVYRDLIHEKNTLIADRDREIAERSETEAEARRLAQELETALEHRSLFFTAMSHDLRTPLNAVLAYSELLEMSDSLDARETDHARRIGAGGRLLLMLVDEILDVAALDAGEQVRLSEDVFRIEDELNDIAGFCGFVGNRDRPSVKVDADQVDAGKGALIVGTDRRRLRQCLSNLIFNAFKHAGDATAVWVEIGRRTDGGVDITVADDGRGIPEDVLARIGEPFMRAGVPYKTESSSGFGLYMVGRYMRLLGGEFRIDSVAGEGTRARLMLPAGAVVEGERVGGAVGDTGSGPAGPVLAAPA